jgi:hypothetical protein
MNKELTEFVDGLKPDVAIRGVGRPGRALSISEALAIRGWFDERRKGLVSSGGRPTHPDWTLKRQIPMTDATWSSLKQIANDLSQSRGTISPAQAGALLLEAAVYGPLGVLTMPDLVATAPTDAQLDESLSERDRTWRMPLAFCVGPPRRVAA